MLFITCPICLKPFKQLSIHHLRSHKIENFEVFRSRFPNVPYVSDSTKKAAGVNGLNNRASRSERKCIEGQTRRATNKRKYEEDPIYCLHCHTMIPYEEFTHQHDKKFCDHHCGASYYNAIKYPVENRRIPSPPKSKIIAYCTGCNKIIPKSNKSGMCSECYHDSDLAAKHRGHTFSKHKIYKTDPRTGIEHYLMSSLEELFLDSCIKYNISVSKANKILYSDITGKQHRYYPDFFLPDFDTVIEIKGYLTKEDKIKYDLVTSQNDINFVMLFHRQIEQYVINLRGGQGELNPIIPLAFPQNAVRTSTL